MATTIEPERTLTELVLEQPGLARAFEELQLDYCCGGGQTLEQAAAKRGLDTRTLVATLEASKSDSDGSCRERDWREASLTELCDHIVDVHHVFLRRELPRIGELVAKVANRHGESQPELRQLEVEFAELREDLIDHIDREEGGVFLLCRDLAGDGAEFSPIVLPQLKMHEAAHTSVGEKLATIRGLAGGFKPREGLCTSHRVMLESLHELERDLHQHIHEENNVLFPLLKERLDETATSAAARGA